MTTTSKIKLVSEIITNLALAEDPVEWLSTTILNLPILKNYMLLTDVLFDQYRLRLDIALIGLKVLSKWIEEQLLTTIELLQPVRYIMISFLRYDNDLLSYNIQNTKYNQIINYFTSNSNFTDYWLKFITRWQDNPIAWPTDSSFLYYKTRIIRGRYIVIGTIDYSLSFVNQEQYKRFQVMINSRFSRMKAS